MEQKYLLIDIDRCWGCKSCTVACKQYHELPAESLSPISVIRIESQTDSGEVFCDFLPVLCQHCTEPSCMAACPKSAIVRDEEGLVQILKDRCIGCGKCAGACPYGAISLLATSGRGRSAYKCTMCAERRQRGGKTFCEQHCPGGVFQCVNSGEAAAYLAKHRYHVSIGRVIYTSNTLENLGRAFAPHEGQGTETKATKE